MFAIGLSIYGDVRTATLTDLRILRKTAAVVSLCQRAKAGDENAKKQLPVWTPSCSEFRDGKRTSANALRLTGLLMLDFDQKGRRIRRRPRTQGRRTCHLRRAARPRAPRQPGQLQTSRK